MMAMERTAGFGIAGFGHRFCAVCGDEIPDVMRGYACICGGWYCGMECFHDASNAACCGQDWAMIMRLRREYTAELQQREIDNDG